MAKDKDDFVEKQNDFAVSNQIKTIREAKNISQMDLAAAAGMSQATVSLLEVGKKKISLEIAIRLADALSCSIDYLLCRNTTPNSPVGQLLAAYERLDIPRQKMFSEFVQRHAEVSSN